MVNLAYLKPLLYMVQNASGKSNHTCRKKEEKIIHTVHNIYDKTRNILTKLIVDIFCSDQNQKAQLIFTTHDISLLNNNQFRRDEIVFIDKNEHGESSLYALSDLKVHDGANFNKDYLQGKYGAIPIFNYDKIIGGEANG